MNPYKFQNGCLFGGRTGERKVLDAVSHLTYLIVLWDIETNFRFCILTTPVLPQPYIRLQTQILPSHIPDHCRHRCSL